MISFLRFLDWSGSAWRRFWKINRIVRRWKCSLAEWQTYERTGRQFRRVHQLPITGDWTDYPEPGWEWTCQNCKTYSFIRESDMPQLIADWEKAVAYMVNKGYTKGFPAKPTAATAICPNCCFHPGSPE